MAAGAHSGPDVRGAINRIKQNQQLTEFSDRLLDTPVVRVLWAGRSTSLRAYHRQLCQTHHS
jgi:hypothetical protein